MPDSLNSRPDPETMAWWRKVLKGTQHTIALCAEEYVSADERILALETRVTTLEADLEAARAAVGELREEHEESLEKIREAYRQLKQQNGS